MAACRCELARLRYVTYVISDSSFLYSDTNIVTVEMATRMALCYLAKAAFF